MRTSWEKLVQHVSNKYIQDINNDPNRKIKVNLITQFHSTEVLVRHATQESLVRTGQYSIQADLQVKAIMVRSEATADPSDAEIPTKIAIMDNNIAKGDYDLANNIPIEMLESEKTAHGNEWRTYRERNANPEIYISLKYSLILGQCTQLLQDNMNQ